MPVALAALPELVIALVLILLIWAGRALFGGMLSSLASRIPLIGSVLSTAIDAIVSDAVNLARDAAQTAISGALGLILAPVYWVEHILADIWDTFDAVAQVIAYITGTLISMAVNIAVAEARTLVALAVRQVETLIDQIYAIVQGEFRAVYATLDQVEASLVAFIRAEISAVESELEQAIAAETAFVVDVEHALASEISAAIAAETAFVQQVEADAISYTQAAVSALEGTITADTSAITSWVIDQVTSLSTAIDLVQTLTVSLTIGAVQAVEADLGKLKAECTDNLCSGTGALASLLNQLASAGWIGMLLAYAAWGASDPKDCGDATANVLGPIASGALDLVKSAAAAV